jgi:hypothetical protein
VKSTSMNISSRTDRRFCATHDDFTMKVIARANESTATRNEAKMVSRISNSVFSMSRLYSSELLGRFEGLDDADASDG